LITTDGGQAKLADFGLSTVDKYTNDFGVGSSRYMAPECFGREDRDSDSGVDLEFESYNAEAADVWAMGVILMNLIFGRSPWHEASLKDRVFHAYITNDPYILRNHLMLSEKLDAFLRLNVFNMNPEKRCTVQEFHDFVSELEYFNESDNTCAS
jgi:serine/threonine protein kinase